MSLRDEQDQATRKAESLARILARYPDASRSKDGRIEATMSVRDFTISSVDKVPCGLVEGHEGDHSINFGDGRVMTWEKR